MNETLRKEVKMLKALQGITYKEIASYLEITDDSFYNWLAGHYNLSMEKQQTLKEIIDTLQE